MGETNAPSIKERSDGPVSLSVKWCGDKSSNSPAERLDNMMNVNQIVKGTSPVLDNLTGVNRVVWATSPVKETPDKTIVLAKPECQTL